MDYQLLFNGAVTLAAFFGGWVLKTITDAIGRLDEDVRAMPHTYVVKEDYRNDIADMKKMLERIFDRLDAKADKTGK